MRRTLAVVLALVLPAIVRGQGTTTPAPMPVPTHDEALRAALISRGRQDQAVREVFLAGHHQDSTDLRQLADVDADNTSFLKKIVAERGWPGRSLVGRDAADAAFLILQHSPDTAFQAKTLPLLEKAYANGEAEGQQVALLTDRVAVQRGQPQTYGTQAAVVNGRFRLKPIADSANVDARRAKLGMPPVAAYMRILDSLYSTRIP
jgi:hypothetical protein